MGGLKEGKGKGLRYRVCLLQVGPQLGRNFQKLFLSISIYSYFKGAKEQNHEWSFYENSSALVFVYFSLIHEFLHALVVHRGSSRALAFVTAIILVTIWQ